MKSFRKPSLVIQHERSHTGVRPYCCDICGRCFITVHHLRRHKSVHSEEKPYKCDKCDKHFKTKDNMRVHQTTHMKLTYYPWAVWLWHLIVGNVSWLPIIWGDIRVFIVKRNLINAKNVTKALRERTSWTSPDYSHEIILIILARNWYRYACVNSVNSDQHRSVHTDVKPYKCKKCDKSFKRNFTRLLTWNNFDNFGCKLVQICLSNSLSLDQTWECSYKNETLWMW